MTAGFFLPLLTIAVYSSQLLSPASVVCGTWLLVPSWATAVPRELTYWLTS